MPPSSAETVAVVYSAAVSCHCFDKISASRQHLLVHNTRCSCALSISLQGKVVCFSVSELHAFKSALPERFCYQFAHSQLLCNTVHTTNTRDVAATNMVLAHTCTDQS